MVEVIDLAKEKLPEPYLSFLFYGRSGAGKTTLAAQFPKPFFLACDHGVTHGILSAVPWKPKVVYINEWEDWAPAVDKAKELIAKGEVKTVIADPITYFARLIMKDILSRATKEIPRLEEWNLAQLRLFRSLNLFGECNAHQILCATEQIVKDERLGQIFGLPNVPGKMAHDTPPLVDVVLRMSARADVDENGDLVRKYVITSIGDELWEGKVRGIERRKLVPNQAITSTPEESFAVLAPLLDYVEKQREVDEKNKTKEDAS